MSDWQVHWEIVDASEKPLGGGQGSIVRDLPPAGVPIVWRKSGLQH
jgi:hypothetical protein